MLVLGKYIGGIGEVGKRRNKDLDTECEWLKEKSNYLILY